MNAQLEYLHSIVLLESVLTMKVLYASIIICLPITYAYYYTGIFSAGLNCQNLYCSLVPKFIASLPFVAQGSLLTLFVCFQNKASSASII